LVGAGRGSCRACGGELAAHVDGGADDHLRPDDAVDLRRGKGIAADRLGRGRWILRREGGCGLEHGEGDEGGKCERESGDDGDGVGTPMPRGFWVTHHDLGVGVAARRGAVHVPSGLTLPTRRFLRVPPKWGVRALPSRYCAVTARNASKRTVTGALLAEPDR